MINLLDIDDLSVDEIELINNKTDEAYVTMKSNIKKCSTLSGKIIVTVFYEPSTRTRISFEEAGKILGADVINMSVSESSVEKGESLLNTGLTLQAMGVDAIIIRHYDSGAPYVLARKLKNVSIINAGDGMHSHPTQALIDIYTAIKHFGDLRGIKLVIVGDIAHSRVARSAMIGFRKMGADVILSGPPALLPELPVNEKIYIEHNLNAALHGADLIMPLRINFERQQLKFISGKREYIRDWQINNDRMNLAKTNALLMHPTPINEGIEVSSDVAHGTQSLIETQVTYGVAVRMVVLDFMLT